MQIARAARVRLVILAMSPDDDADRRHCLELHEPLLTKHRLNKPDERNFPTEHLREVAGHGFALIERIYMDTISACRR